MASGKMKPHPNSPNGCFERHGYHTHRFYGAAGNIKRIIVAPTGHLALVNPSYDKSIDYCRKAGLLED